MRLLILFACAVSLFGQCAVMTINPITHKLDCTSSVAGATIPSVTNLIKGDGAGNGADSGIDPATVITGSGTAGQIGVFTGSTAVVGFTNLKRDPTTGQVTIGEVATPTGPNLITDGDFATCPGSWTLGSDTVCTPGVGVTSTYAGGDPSITSNTFSTVSGTLYAVTFTISGLGGPGSPGLYFYLANSSNPVLKYGNGTHTEYYASSYTGAAETVIFDDWQYAAGDTWGVDNVSVKAAGIAASPLTVTGWDGSPWLSFYDGTRSMVTKVGGRAGKNNTGIYFTGTGYNAGQNNTGEYFTGTGFGAGENNTGNQVTVTGWNAGNRKTAGDNVVFDGAGDVLRGSQTAIDNSVAVGASTAIAGKTGINNSGGTQLTNIIAINGVATDSNQTVIGNSGTLTTRLFGKTSSEWFSGVGSAPSVATCGTIGTGSTNAAGFITSATTGSCVSVLTFASATATTGWSCAISNATTANLITQTGSSTTTATFTGTTVSDDVLRYACTAY